MNDQPTKTTRTFTNREGTLLVTLWPNGKLDVQARPTNTSEWGMPVRCHEERGNDAQ